MQLDWSTAEVRDQTLTVQLTGDSDDDWIQTFERTLAMLSTGQGWGAIKLKSGTLKVKNVAEGSEENLRFALDGAVQEADAHTASEDDDPQDGEEPDDDASDAASETDRRMTERFRDPS